MQLGYFAPLSAGRFWTWQDELYQELSQWHEREKGSDSVSAEGAFSYIHRDGGI